MAPLGFDGDSLIPCYGMAEATLFVSGKRAGSRYRAEPAPQVDGDGRPVVSCGEVDSEHTVPDRRHQPASDQCPDGDRR